MSSLPTDATPPPLPHGWARMRPAPLPGYGPPARKRAKVDIGLEAEVVRDVYGVADARYTEASPGSLGGWRFRNGELIRPQPHTRRARQQMAKMLGMDMPDLPPRAALRALHQAWQAREHPRPTLGVRPRLTVPPVPETSHPPPQRPDLMHEVSACREALTLWQDAPLPEDVHLALKNMTRGHWPPMPLSLSAEDTPDGLLHWTLRRADHTALHRLTLPEGADPDTDPMLRLSVLLEWTWKGPER